ncbi:MAG: SAM-dependent methyltransferase [Rhodospirillaceae bacterium]|nr:SAM-dependent methyltransferase [Magnetovibrio sp.]MAY67243.1 SAM-dependent methyltransferase [Rhodospirillaceae bacterium]
MKEINFLAKYQKATKRDYVQRVVEHDKAESAEIARQWGRDYWDGDRRYGYGGYSYDGRWRPIAEDIVREYGLKAGDKVLDVGCGKAFLLYEITQAAPGLDVAGIDISEYGIENAKPEVRDRLTVGNCTDLPWEDDTFDFVYSINTLHNLEVFDLKRAIQEIERVGKDKKWICVESFRNEREKANLLYWQLTCMSFHSPDAWRWLYQEYGYTGDCGFIYFE